MSAKHATDRRSKITGKLKTALDLMVWGDENGAPLDWDDAARNAKITVRAMRKALEKPHVRAYLRRQREVVRAAIGAKTLHRLAELRDQDENRNAAVSAAKALEQLPDEPSAGGGGPSAPGLVIVVLGAPAQATVQPPVGKSPVMIEHRPRDGVRETQDGF